MRWYEVGAIGRKRKQGVSRARILASVGVLAAVLYTLWLVQTRKVEAYQVTSESMEPALKVGERWLMVQDAILKPGQIAVFDHPEERGVMLVKRLVALGPAEVELRGGYLYVNGTHNQPPQGEEVLASQNSAHWKLQPGEAFMVGDNREMSHDSRDFGPVPQATIRGVLSRRIEKPGFLSAFFQ